MSSNRNPTAWETEQELRKDPEFIAMRARQDAEYEALKERSKAEQAMLLADLRKEGYRIESIWDFVNTADSYRGAIPVLLNHLQRPYADIHRQGIARALTVREARGVAGPVIIDVLRKSGEADPQLRWALANALTIVADRDNRDDIKALIGVETNPDVAARLKRALKTAAKP